jgi:fimbrial chaperone protein
MRAIALALLATGMLAAADEAAASALSIAPIRVELTGAKRTAVLTLRNQEDAPVVVQARPVAWSQQDGGEDQLDDTHDLVVTPPIFTVPPRGQQVLRIALLRDVDPARELDYRLVLSEVPSPSAVETTGLKVAIRITLPVFVTSAAKSAADLTWQHQWLSDGTLDVTAQNHGTAHIQILGFDVQQTGSPAQKLHASASHYLLPGTLVHWQLKPESDLAHDAQLVIQGRSDAGDFTVTSSPGSP